MGNYHEWGDPDFDWKALDDAGWYIEKNCRRWARMGIWTKEKYGTLRISDTCAYWSYWPIHEMFYPGYVYYRWPKWMIKWIEYPLAEVFMFLRITKLINRYQTWVLKFFWRRAAKKWAHISEEILSEYDFYFGADE